MRTQVAYQPNLHGLTVEVTLSLRLETASRDSLSFVFFGEADLNTVERPR